MVSELAGPIANHFDQFCDRSFAWQRGLTLSAHLKTPTLPLPGDRIIGITRLLGASAPQPYIRLPGFSTVIEDSHPDQLLSFFDHQGILIR